MDAKLRILCQEKFYFSAQQNGELMYLTILQNYGESGNIYGRRDSFLCFL